MNYTKIVQVGFTAFSENSGFYDFEKNRVDNSEFMMREGSINFKHLKEDKNSIEHSSSQKPKEKERSKERTIQEALFVVKRWRDIF